MCLKSLCSLCLSPIFWTLFGQEIGHQQKYMCFRCISLGLEINLWICGFYPPFMKVWCQVLHFTTWPSIVCVRQCSLTTAPFLVLHLRPSCGKGGPQIFVYLKSYFVCELKPHAKPYDNPFWEKSNLVEEERKITPLTRKPLGPINSFNFAWIWVPIITFV